MLKIKIITSKGKINDTYEQEISDFLGLSNQQLYGFQVTTDNQGFDTAYIIYQSNENELEYREGDDTEVLAAGEIADGTEDTGEENEGVEDGTTATDSE
jgi:hypothetical protein